MNDAFNKLSNAEVDENALRITKILAPILGEENPAHVVATLTLALCSYLTLISVKAQVDPEEVDRTIDQLMVKIRKTIHEQRIHVSQKAGHA